jgi:hypothetical protein
MSGSRQSRQSLRVDEMRDAMEIFLTFLYLFESAFNSLSTRFPSVNFFSLSANPDHVVFFSSINGKPLIILKALSLRCQKII